MHTASCRYRFIKHQHCSVTVPILSLLVPCLLVQLLLWTHERRQCEHQLCRLFGMHVIAETTRNSASLTGMRLHHCDVGVMCGNALRILCLGVNVRLKLAVNTLCGSEA